MLQNSHKRIFFVWLAIFLQISVGITPTAYAVEANCDPLLANLKKAINECNDLNSNTVCYGNVQAEAQPFEYRFFQTRDRRPFGALAEVKTLDPDGVVLMNLSFVGVATPATVLLLGALEVEKSKQAPNVMTLRVADNQYLCNDTLPGIAVQTASHQPSVVTINDVDIELASTIFVTMQPDGIMTIVNIEGNVKVTIGGQSIVLLPGYQILVETTNGAPRFRGGPLPSRLVTSPVLRWLTTTGLRQVHNTNTTTQACVGTLKFGETITTQNYYPGQECLYHFCAKAGDVATVSMKAVDQSLDPWVDLRGPGGWLVSFNNDIDGKNADSLVCNRVLPLTSCDYTIVARSTRNASAGPFKLTLNKYSACTQPELRCSVVARTGVNLHQGPGANYAVIGNLPQNTYLHPRERTPDGQWAYVDVGNSQQTGWVNQQPNTVECEDDDGLAVAASVPTATPAPPPPEKRKQPTPTPACTRKCSPIPGP